MKTLLTVLLALPLLAQQAPAPVTGAIQKAYPNSKITAVKKELDKGRTVYEVETRDGKVSRDFVVKPDGTILETEEGMELSAVPPKVMDAVKARRPKAVIIGAEKLARGADVLYELVLQEGGRKSELSVNAAGQIQR